MSGEDAELSLAYYLYLDKGLLPGDYYKKSAGEKLLLQAFFALDMERREEGR